MTALLYISAAVFVAYIVTMCAMFGELTSISESYYLLERKHKGLGWIFTGWCWVEALTLLPYLMHVCPENMKFMAFWACVGLAFVGVAPQTKAIKMEKTVHFVGATMSGGLSVLIIFLMGYAPCPIIAIIIATILMVYREKKWLLWLEIAGFVSTYTALIINNLK